MHLESNVDLRTYVTAAAGLWVEDRCQFFRVGYFFLADQLKSGQKVFPLRFFGGLVVKARDVRKLVRRPLDHVLVALLLQVFDTVAFNFTEGVFTNSLDGQDIRNARKFQKLVLIVIFWLRHKFRSCTEGHVAPKHLVVDLSKLEIDRYGAISWVFKVSDPASLIV